MTAKTFPDRATVADLEEGAVFAPKFDQDGLIPAIATDHASGELLMVAYMNAESLAMTIESGEAVYYSRSRKKLWHKGESSGNVQKIREIRVDCDQDCLWLRVEQIGGAACHTGYRSCFFRRVPFGAEADQPLTTAETAKTFDPATVYGKK